MIDNDLFETFEYIEYDEESGIWQSIDPDNFVESAYQSELQAAQEENIPPRIQKVHKVPKVQPEKEQWSHKRVAPNVVELSNTKYLRQCVTKELLPPNSYVILPVQEYQAFRNGSKDFKYGAPCIILVDPSHCLGSISQLGLELDTHFGFTSPEDTVNS